MDCKLLTDLIWQNFERQYCLSSNELLKNCTWSYLSDDLNSTALERINRNERNVIRKKKESIKEFWNLALVILDQAFITQSFAIMIPNVPICARISR